MIAEDMLVLQGLTDDQAPVALIQSALHKYDSYQKKKQGEEEASGLAQEDDAAPGNAAVGPVARFLFDAKWVSNWQKKRLPSSKNARVKWKRRLLVEK